VLNGGAVNAGFPGRWPGLLFNRMLIGSWSGPGVNNPDAIVSRIRGWDDFLATAAICR
jgi:hypothetical protein